jgi:hypothetical protein
MLLNYFEATMLVTDFNRFPFIDKVLRLESGNLNVDLFYDLGIDSNKLRRIIEYHGSTLYWFEFSAIKFIEPDHGSQLNLLEDKVGPALIVPSEDYIYLFIFKTSHEPGVPYYGKDQKDLISLLVKKELLNIVNSSNSEKEASINYMQVCKNQTNMIVYLNNELSNLKASLDKMCHSLCNYFLSDNISSSTVLDLPNSTIEIILNTKKTYSQLREEVIQAYQIAISLGESPDFIRLEPYFFPASSLYNSPKEFKEEAKVQILHSEPIEINKDPRVKNATPEVKTDKLAKTLILLNRYDSAIKSLLDNHLPVMGKNIANACNPKISAPALTDSINKHKDRIVTCLKLYPQKWPLLRKHYAPIKKLEGV